jgi:hypothetical protein
MNTISPLLKSSIPSPNYLANKDLYESFEQIYQNTTDYTNFDISSSDEEDNYITLIDHPFIENTEIYSYNEINIENDMNNNKNSDGEEIPKSIIVHWDPITHFYFGSLTVVGLYILFRLIQKTR